LTSRSSEHILLLKQPFFNRLIIGETQMRRYSTDPNSPDNPHSLDYEPTFIYEKHVTHGGGPICKPIETPLKSPNDDYYKFVSTVFGEASSSNYVLYDDKYYYASTVMEAEKDNLQTICTEIKPFRHIVSSRSQKYADQFNPHVIVTHGMTIHPLNSKKGLMTTSITDAAWMAVASVMANRVGRHEWINCQKVTDVIKHGFDAYTDPQYIQDPSQDPAYSADPVTYPQYLKAHGLFLAAYAYLTTLKIDHSKYASLGFKFPSLDLKEQALLTKMEADLRDIYNGKVPAEYQNLFYYISPLTEIYIEGSLYNSGTVPVFCHPWVESVSGLHDNDDFSFFGY
jgi:hypothetical protein